MTTGCLSISYGFAGAPAGNIFVSSNDRASAATNATALTNARYEAAAVHKIYSAINKITSDLTRNCSLEIRLKDWQELTDAIHDGFYEKAQRGNIYTGSFKAMDGLFQKLCREKGLIVNDKGSLTAFLSKFPKMEAIYLLQLYVQTYMDPDSDNDDFVPPEKLDKIKSGDCNDVAWYNYEILNSLGVPSSALKLNFDLAFAMETGIGSHAAVKFNFKENGKTYNGIIDNYNVNFIRTDMLMKKYIHSVYPRVSDFMVADTAVWRKVGCEKCDETSKSWNKFTHIKMVYRETAKKIYGTNFSLGELFENPSDDVLFFKDDAEKIIIKSALPNNIVRPMYNFYFKAGNKPQ
jgi:predicted transglutaminase-like cysteine proteinase